MLLPFAQSAEPCFAASTQREPRWIMQTNDGQSTGCFLDTVTPCRHFLKIYYSFCDWLWHETCQSRIKTQLNDSLCSSASYSHFLLVCSYANVRHQKPLWLCNILNDSLAVLHEINKEVKHRPGLISRLTQVTCLEKLSKQGFFSWFLGVFFGMTFTPLLIG